MSRRSKDRFSWRTRLLLEFVVVFSLQVPGVFGGPLQGDSTDENTIGVLTTDSQSPGARVLLASSCPSLGSPCTNEVNRCECLVAEAVCPGQVVTTKSCPGKYHCGSSYPKLDFARCEALNQPSTSTSTSREQEGPVAADSSSSSSDVSVDKTTTTSVSDSGLKSICPGVDESCMNTENHCNCLAHEALCRGQVMFLESCPLQFRCMGGAEPDLSECPKWDPFASKDTAAVPITVAPDTSTSTSTSTSREQEGGPVATDSSSSSSDDVSVDKTTTTSVSDSGLKSICPGVDESCMNTENHCNCLAHEALCPGQVMFLESCPLQFGCESGGAKPDLSSCKSGTPSTSPSSESPSDSESESPSSSGEPSPSAADKAQVVSDDSSAGYATMERMNAPLLWSAAVGAAGVVLLSTML